MKASKTLKTFEINVNLQRFSTAMIYYIIITKYNAILENIYIYSSEDLRNFAIYGKIYKNAK